MRKFFPLLVLLLALFAACDRDKDAREKLTPLAEVNGDVLTLEGFRSTFTDEQWNNLTAEQKKQEIENWVKLTLLAQEAEAQELDEERAVKQRVDYAAKKNFGMHVRMASLLHDIGKPAAKSGDGPDATFYNHEIIGARFAKKILQRLKFSKKDADKIVLLVRYHLFYYNLSEYLKLTLPDHPRFLTASMNSVFRQNNLFSESPLL